MVPAHVWTSWASPSSLLTDAAAPQELPAGRPVGRPARVTGLAVDAALPGAPGASDGGRGTSHQQPQGAVLRAFIGTFGQRPRMDRAEHRSAVRIDDRDDRLRPAREVEHDAVERGTVGSDGDEVSWSDLIHAVSVPVDGAAPIPLGRSSDTGRAS
jgi:hypothetical protein